MIRKGVAGFVLALILLSGNVGWCETLTGEEEVYAVQNRVFHRDHELDLSIGYVADDDFFHVYPISLGYTMHFDDVWSWEIARFGFMFNQDKDLKETLENEFGAQPERFPEQKYMLHSHAVYKPLYGKHALLNRKVVNNEIYVFAGAGIVHYEWNHSSGTSDEEDAFSVDFGVGMRFFLSEKLCLNAEVRHLINFRDDDTENNMYFGAGVGYRFNMAPRKVVEDPTVKRLKKILEEK